MHQIDGAGATETGEFTKGSPATGTPATVVTDEWLNTVQREILNVMSEAGIAPNKSDDTQLYQAIQALIAAATQSSGFSTGDGKVTLKAVADPGWILLNDGTIGKSGTAATTRANDDTAALYTLLWTNVADTWAPVAGGRGANAGADFAAGKLMGVPKVLGRALAIAGTGAGLSARSLGQVLGEEAHLLTSAESGVPAHTHNFNADVVGTGIGGQPNYQAGGTNNAGVIDPNDAQDAAQAHNTMQPTSFWNVMVKL